MRKFFIVLLLLSLGVLLGNWTAQADPEILSVNPVSGTSSVATNTRITVMFNEDMLASSIGSDTTSTGTFTVSYDDSGVVYVDGNIEVSGSVAKFTPDFNLSMSTLYTCKMGTGTVNSYGSSSSGLEWTFTTCNTTDDANAGVWYAYPYDNDTGVSVGIENIYIVFSERQDPSTITENITIVGDGGAVEGNLYYYDYGANYVGTPTAIFQPSGNLSYSSNFTVTANTNVLDLAGNALTSNFTSSFSTESAPSVPDPWIPPITKFSVESIFPKNGEEVSDSQCQITVKFNMPVDTDWSLAADPLSFSNESEEFYPMGVYSGFYEEGGGKKIIFTLSDDEQWPEGKITVKVLQNRVRAANSAGTQMTQNYEFSFKVSNGEVAKADL
ncbi:MAG: Ig-like domain-containing protein [bacterium]|nr:Ig-like domain-containing protein [bacterium]